MGALKAVCTRLYGHTAGDLRHRCKQGQAATSLRDGFVGDANCAAGDQIATLIRIRRQMQVGEQYLVAPQHGTLRRLGLFHLDDHVCACKHLGRRSGHACTGFFVGAIGRADARTGILFDQHHMAVRSEFADRRGRQSDAVFVVFNFFRHADQHHLFSLLSVCEFQHA